MSSILKALKKLDDDKAARKPEELRIDSEILRNDGSSRFSPTVIIVAALLLLAGGSGTTYMYMNRHKAPEQASRQKAAAPSGHKQLVTPEPSGLKSEQLPASVVVVPAEQQTSSKADNRKQQQASVPAKTSTTTAVPTGKAINNKPASAQKDIEQSKRTAPQPAPPASAKTVPVLRVNGIAFQEGSTDSVAIINGVPVTSGAVVEGVKVDEIHKNRVKFSFNGEKFEIPLGQSNR